MIEFYSFIGEFRHRKYFNNSDSSSNRNAVYCEGIPWETADQLLKELLHSGLVEKEWYDFQLKMKCEFLEYKSNFLRQNNFVRTVSVSPPFPFLDPEIRYYLRRIKDKSNVNLRNLLIFEGLGHPFIASIKYGSTFTRIQHLYQLFLYQHLNGTDLLNFSGTILEVGGGYGDMAHLIYKNNSTKPTYIISDLPFMINVQYVYLCATLGNHVNLLQDVDGKYFPEWLTWFHLITY